jgi:hypothetical protein
MTLLVSRKAGSDPEGSVDEGKERGLRKPWQCATYWLHPLSHLLSVS